MEQDNPEKETGHLEERTITEKVRVKEGREQNARYTVISDSSMNIRVHV